MSNKNQKIDIEQVAHLARIELTDAEKQKFEGELSKVLVHFEQLNSFDVSNVEPSTHPFDVYNVWDNDKAGPTFTPEEALANAPQQKDNYIVVPRVVE